MKKNKNEIDSKEEFKILYRDMTTITLPKSLRSKLANLGNTSDRYEDIIRRLVILAEKNIGQYKIIVSNEVEKTQDRNSQAVEIDVDKTKSINSTKT